MSFDADVGLDAEVFPAEGGTASVKFIVRADGRTVAQTPVLKGSREGVHVHAELAGAKFVELVVSEAGDGNTWDHSDWADAYFTMQDGAKPVPVKMGGEQLGILTPKAPASLGLEGSWRIRDLWRQQDVGIASGSYSAEVFSHATTLVRLFPQPGAGLRKGMRDIRDNAVYMMYAPVRPVDKPGYVPPADSAR